MSIFDRLARLARAEFNHVKAVIADKDDDAPEAVRNQRQEDLRRAQAELERAEAMLRNAQLDDGSAGWGDGADAEARPSGNDAYERGASAWGQADDDDDDPIVDANTGERAQPREPRPEAAPGWTSARRQTSAYPREIRLAYAALELPLGSDREAVDAAHRALVERYHPDRHGQNPQMTEAASELTRRVGQARDQVFAWLDGR